MKRLLLTAVTSVAMLAAGAANAAVVSYASYQQANSSSKSIQYVNNANDSHGNPVAGGTLSTIGTPLVNFQFGSPVIDSYGNTVNLDPSLTAASAVFWMSATSNSTAVSSACGSFTCWDQIFQSGDLGFKTSGGANLLTIHFTNMDFSGRQSAASASTFASTPGSIVSITSDFFDFSQVVQADFSFSLSAVIQNLSIAGNGSFNDFTASSTGTFDSDPAPIFIPEPGMLGLFGAGAIGLAFARRRKK